VHKQDFELRHFNGVEFEIIPWDSYTGAGWKLWQSAQRAATEAFAAVEDDSNGEIVMYQVWLKSSPRQRRSSDAG